MALANSDSGYYEDLAYTNNPTSHSGATWQETSARMWNSTTSTTKAVACASTFCIALGSSGQVAVNHNPSNYSSWSQSSNTLPSGGTYSTLSCGSTFCIALSGTSVAVTDDPTDTNPVWTSAGTISPLSGSPAISCAPLFCIALGTGGSVALTLDPQTAAPVWVSPGNIPAWSGLTQPAVACVSSYCLALSLPSGKGASATQATITVPADFVTGTTYLYGSSTFPSLPTKATDALGNVTTYTYDSYGDLATATTSPSSGVTNTTQTVYDNDGEKVCQASPDLVAAGTTCPSNGTRVSGATSWVYNSNGWLTSTTNPDNDTNTYGYDNDGNQISETDGLGNVTETTYDADDRVSSVTDGYGTSFESTTTYSYDLLPSSCPSAPSSALWCAQTTDGLGNITSNYYNPLGELIETSPPNTSAQAPTTYTYDGAGNDLTVTSGAGTTTNTYDSDNRLTGVAYSNTPSGFTQPHSVSYSYDADNDISQMIDGTGTTTYTYDSLERLSSVTDGDGDAVTYGLDLDSNMTCLSYPNSGTKTCQNSSSGTGLVAYNYNGVNEVSSMVDWLGNTTNFSYDHDGNLLTTVLPSGTSTTINDVYDSADALTDTSFITSGSKTDFGTLSRNANEEISATTGSAGTYSYDPLTRVTGDSFGSYGYDAGSELNSVTPSGSSATTQEYHADGQLCWAGNGGGACSSPPSGATTFSYDSVGDRTQTVGSGGATTSYGWNQAGELVCETAANTAGSSCSNPSSSLTSTYAYNGQGIRTSATLAGGQTEQFSWSNGNLVADGASFYLYGPAVGVAPIEQISRSGGTASYLMSDVTGVREQLNGSGSAMGTMSYDTYGNPCSSCSMSSPFGFGGSYTDSTGLVYMIHRYYDSISGQFISVDPDVGSTHQPYAYTGGDPVNNTDPEGLRLPIAVSCSTSCQSETPSGLGNSGVSVATPAAASSTSTFYSWLAVQPYSVQTYFELLYLASVGYISPGASVGTSGAAGLEAGAAPAAATATADYTCWPESCSQAGALNTYMEDSTLAADHFPTSDQMIQAVGEVAGQIGDDLGMGAMCGTGGASADSAAGTWLVPAAKAGTLEDPWITIAYMVAFAWGCGGGDLQDNPSDSG